MNRKKKETILRSNEHSPIPFQSLEELVITLSEEERSKYTDIMRFMKLPDGTFENHCSWSNNAYTRNCIAENEKFELILLCWEAGQITPIHDHGGEECWVKIIEGEIKETIYKLDETGDLHSVKTSIAKTGDISYMVDFMGVHRLENLSSNRSMSLHLYAKPIRNCKVYDNELGKFVRKDMVYSTVSEMVTNLK